MGILELEAPVELELDEPGQGAQIGRDPEVGPVALLHADLVRSIDEVVLAVDREALEEVRQLDAGAEDVSGVPRGEDPRLHSAAHVVQADGECGEGPHLDAAAADHVRGDPDRDLVEPVHLEGVDPAAEDLSIDPLEADLDHRAPQGGVAGQVVEAGQIQGQAPADPDVEVSGGHLEGPLDAGEGDLLQGVGGPPVGDVVITGEDVKVEAEVEGGGAVHQHQVGAVLEIHVPLALVAVQLVHVRVVLGGEELGEAEPHGAVLARQGDLHCVGCEGQDEQGERQEESERSSHLSELRTDSTWFCSNGPVTVPLYLILR